MPIRRNWRLGATTVYQVIQDQRDLTTAAAAEVTAQATYAGARVQLDVATGSTLANNNVEFDEAKSATSRRLQTRCQQLHPTGKIRQGFLR